MSYSFPTTITAMKLLVSTGSDTYEQPITPSDLSGTTNNSVVIHNTSLIGAFNNNPIGTIFNASIVTTYAPNTFPSSDILSVPSVSNFVPQPIETNLSLSQTSLTKNTLDADFLLSSLVTITSNNPTGARSFSSSHPQFASINSSSGLVNLHTGGTTTITISQGVSSDNVYTAAATPVSLTLQVDKVVPTLSIADIPNKLTTAASFSVSVTSPSDGLKSYSSSHPQFATIDSSSGLVTLVSGGTTNIIVSQAASLDGVYAAAGPVSTQLVVDKAVPTLSIADIPNKLTTADSFSVSVTSPSDGALSYLSSHPQFATIDSSSGLVTLVSGGTTNIIVSQAASANGVYAAAGPVSTQLVVNTTAPTFGSFSIGSRDFNSGAFTFTPPSSNSSGAFTFTSSNTAVATFNNLNPNALKFNGVNNTVALSRYPTLNSTNTLTIEGWIYITSYTKNIITLNYHSGIDILADGKISVWTNFTGNGWVNVTSDSSVPLNSWSYIAVVINDGGYNKIYINNTLVKNSVNTGSGLFIACTAISLAANAPANANFSNISISEFRIWSVARTAQQIADNYNIQIPSNSSGLVIYYKFDQGTANGTNTGLTTLIDSTSNNYHGTLRGFALSGTTSNWVSGPILALLCTIVGAGTTIITATQVAAGNYTSKSTGADFVVNPIAPTFVGTFTVPAKDFNSAPFTLTPPSSNSLGVFSYASSDPAVASIVGNVVTIVGVGTAVITATQAATTNYTSKSTGADFVVNQTAPTFGSFSIGSREFGSAPFTLTPPSSNSLGAFTFTSSKPEVATVGSTTGEVTIIGVGTTIITVTQASAGNYTASLPVTASFVVNPTAPTFGSFSIGSRDFNSGAFTFTPPSSNSLGAFTFTSSNTAVATLNNPNPNALKFNGVNNTVALSRYPTLNSTNT